MKLNGKSNNQFRSRAWSLPILKLPSHNFMNSSSFYVLKFCIIQWHSFSTSLGSCPVSALSVIQLFGHSYWNILICSLRHSSYWRSKPKNIYVPGGFFNHFSDKHQPRGTTLPFSTAHALSTVSRAITSADVSSKQVVNLSCVLSHRQGRTCLQFVSPRLSFAKQEHFSTRLLL